MIVQWDLQMFDARRNFRTVTVDSKHFSQTACQMWKPFLSARTFPPSREPLLINNQIVLRSCAIRVPLETAR